MVVSATIKRCPVPVTAKFSEEFYERLGHDVADELVNWFNAVDATYRSDFRDLFDSRFATFEQRLAAFEAKVEQRIAELRAELRAELAGVEARLQGQMHGMETRLTRWMFVTWIGTIGTLIALLRLSG